MTSSQWWWKCLSGSGEEIERETESFPTRGDAESWLGEAWADLAGAGVESVTLLEGDREVYGPMSLSA